MATAYAASPRPTYDGPAHIPYSATARHLWGDEVSGVVSDWIYVSSDKIHQLVFGLPPGGSFRHSDAHRTVFAADEVYYVLSGTLVATNPETGEVHRVRSGEALFFRRDTWHHAVNYDTEPLRVLEFFAPPPSQGTSGAYARTRPYLAHAPRSQDHLLARWPAARADAVVSSTMQVVREDALLWRLEGCEGPLMVGVIASTDQLTVAKAYLLPGHHTEVRSHGGDLGLYLPAGTLHVRLPQHEGQRWFEVQAGDGFYIPDGVPHQYYNLSGETVEFVFGVAPRYLPADLAGTP